MKQLQLFEQVDFLHDAMQELAQRFDDGMYHDTERYGASGRWYAVVIDGAEYLAAIDYAPSQLVDDVFEGRRPEYGRTAGVGLPFYNVCSALRGYGDDDCLDHFEMNGRMISVAVVKAE